MELAYVKIIKKLEKIVEVEYDPKVETALEVAAEVFNDGIVRFDTNDDYWGETDYELLPRLAAFGLQPDEYIYDKDNKVLRKDYMLTLDKK